MHFIDLVDPPFRLGGLGLIRSKVYIGGRESYRTPLTLTNCVTPTQFLILKSPSIHFSFACAD